jgi:pyruvate/2-oxoglutarate dehydrogenase complex dihydrolipoamide dehydrogenase (E3) component
MIKHSDFVDFKWPLAQFKSYLIRQVQKKGINLKLNTFATPELIKSEDCDAAIIALGASPVVPPIPGLENAPFVFAPNAMTDPSALGQKVVVIGGGEVGVEAGMVIAATGRDVTVLEMRPELASDATAIHYRSMFQAAWEAIPTFKGITNAKVAKAEQGYVTYADVAGAEISIQADSIVVAVGMRSKQAEALSFSDCADRVRFVGDCVAPASIQQALRAAYAAACSI